MNGTGGYQLWGIWVLVFVGCAAFWAVISVALRALYTGQNTNDSPAPDRQEPSMASLEQARLHERLVQGEITDEEYAHLRAEAETGSSRHARRSTTEL
jgi:uncharacterized membrane protein